MQKKFLRTSVLTLVMGVSHLNEIHAMDEADLIPNTKLYNGPNMATANLEREINMCSKLRSTPLKKRAHWPTFIYEGRWSGKTHRVEPTVSSASHVYKPSNVPYQWSSCEVCTDLYERIEVINELESQSQRTIAFAIAAKKRSEEAAHRARYSRSTSYAPCPAPSHQWTTPPGTTHYAPSTHIAHRTALVELMAAQRAQDPD